MADFQYVYPEHPDSFQEMRDLFMKKCKGKYCKEGFVKYIAKRRIGAVRDLSIIKMQIYRNERLLAVFRKARDKNQSLPPCRYVERDVATEHVSLAKLRLKDLRAQLKFTEDEIKATDSYLDYLSHH